MKNRWMKFASTLLTLSIAWMCAGIPPAAADTGSIVTSGDRPAAWPSTFTAYTLADGTSLTDPADEPGISPDDVDFTSGADKGIGGLPSYYVASDGTNLFFRVRLKSNPYDRKGGFLSSVWLVQLGVGGTLRATVGVNGKPTAEDYVYVANADGTNVSYIYKTAAGVSPAAVDGTRISTAENGQYFLDFQVPIARISAIASDITASTQIQLHYATSKAANLAVVNKDGKSNSPFDSVKVITPGNVNPTPATSVFIDGGPAQVKQSTTPTITGTTASAGNNYKVDLQINGTTTSKQNVGNDGTWSINTTREGLGLTAGSTYTLTARIYSGSSTSILGTATQQLTILTGASSTTVAITSAASGGPLPTFRGTAAADDTVAVNVDGNVVGQVTADSGGAWSYTPEKPLAAGAHAIKAHAADIAGNTADATQTYTASGDAISIDNGAAVTTNDNQPSLHGTTNAPDGSSIEVDITDANSHTQRFTSADQQVTLTGGRWSMEYPTASGKLDDGTYTVTATVNDDGSSATATQSLLVDTSTFVTIDTPADGLHTSNTAVAIQGTAEANATVTINLDSGANVATVTADGTGSWLYAPPSPFAYAVHTATAAASDPNGNDARTSSTFTVESIVQPAVPTAPVNLSAGGTTQTATSLTWDSVTGATYYNVYKDGAPLASNVSAATYNVTGLTSSTTYSFTVTAANTAGESVPSNAAIVKTLDTVIVPPVETPVVPSVPLHLSAGGTTQTTTALTWDSVTNATYYNVYKDGAPLVSNVSSATYNVTGLTPSTTYSFTVTAANAAGESATSNAAVVTTLADASTVVNTPTIADLLVDQGKRLLAPGDEQPLKATAVDPDESIRDVTSDAVYSSSDATVATVDPHGVVTAKAPGTASITVSYGGKSVTVPFTVQNGVPQVTLRLQATPDSVVGDGVSQLTLRATVAALNGSPVAGVPVTFHIGYSNADLPATTDASGVAAVTLTAPAIQDVVPVNEKVTATATDPSSGLQVMQNVNIHYMPASVKGVLIDQSTNTPIAGAAVSVTADFNGDGVTDFSASVTSGADGSYQVYVPRGNWNYTIGIQATVQIGGNSVQLNTTQTAQVGSLTGTGQDIIPSANKINGLLSIASPGSTAPQASVASLFGAGNVSAVVQGTAGNNFNSTVTLNSDGSFNVDNVPQGQYKIAYQIKAADGTTLAGPMATVNVNQNGQMSIVYSLIDPYGIVTDAATGQPVSGVNMNLYWADTTLNRQNGRTPDMLVNLPVLANFAPNDNRDPQTTDGNGAYAWMVFPNADYYVVASKSGYSDYSTLAAKPNAPAAGGSDSYIQNGVIHVGQSLVSLNFSLSALPASSGSEGGSVSAVQTPSTPAPTAPQAADDVRRGAHEKYIEGYPDGTFKPERNVSRQEVAAMLFRVYHLTKSGTDGMTYSDVSAADWGEREIAAVTRAGLMGGYPDGTFKPNRPITRAEMAGIVARLKHLHGTGQDAFTDIADSWARDDINAANQLGLIKGYSDGTFRPDANTSRAEVVTMIDRLVERGPLTGIAVPTWPDVGTGYWAFGDVEEASTDHQYEVRNHIEARVDK